MLHVIFRASRRCKMKDEIDLAKQAIERFADVNIFEFEARLARELLNIVETSGQKIVECDDRIAFGDQRIAKMRPQEARPARYQYTHAPIDAANQLLCCMRF